MKNILSEKGRPKACAFSIQQCFVEFNINLANHALGVNYKPTLAGGGGGSGGH